MPVSVVVGGQFGSEGKGKVACHFVSESRATVAIRIGGPNSGHTVISPAGKRHMFRHLPTACVLPDVKCVIGPGSYIDVDVLLQEISLSGIDTSRVIIDEHAMILGSDDKQQECNNGLQTWIGSTQSGTGAAVIRRIARTAGAQFAKSHPQLRRFVASTRDVTSAAVEAGQRVVVEGTQGFGLSLLHSPYYPYVTSRDTTAAAFLSEAGLSPLEADDVILVIRAFPIRVSGNSGPLSNEITWETIATEGGHPASLAEYTSVTNKLRRVARFDPSIVRQAISHNRPTRIVLNHLDYIDPEALAGDYLSSKILAFVESVESSIERQVDYLGVSANRLIHRTERLRMMQVA